MQPALTTARFRNRLESGVGEQLDTAGVPYEYEGAWVPYEVPRRKAKYLPDFRTGHIIIETKGWWGRSGAKERQKLILLKDQYPELDIRIIFSDANKPIYKGSPTTYGDWATDHDFQFSTKGIVPPAWIEDLKEESKRVANGTKRRK